MATYKHIRSSTAHKRPTTAIADGQIAINTNTASPGLFFKDSAGTGIVKVGPVHVGTTAPNSSPAAGGSSGNYLGEQWLDTSLTPAQLKVWNGSAWVGVVADELPVSKLQDGQARQLLQTDAAGTGVEWTSNVDVPGTLDVTGATTLDSTLTVPLGSAAAPTLRFSGDANTGVYSPGADQVALSTNGTGRLFVGATGNVGIGTTSPVAQLDVATAGDSSIVIANETTYTDGRKRGRITKQTDNSLVIQACDSASAVDTVFRRTVSAESARIDSSGRLLVGTSSAQTGYGYTPAFQVFGSSANTASSLIEGIGTPVYPTYSRTNVGSTAVVNNDAIFQLRAYGFDGTSRIRAAAIECAIDGTPGTNDMPGRIVLSTTPDGSATPVERMRITNAGAVLIGTQTPVNSSTGSDDGFTAYANGSVHISRADNESLFLRRRSSDGGVINFYRVTSLVGSISVTTTATAYNTSSDYRLKENVTPVTDGITRLQQLKPSRFNFIANPNTIVDGFLAHEVQAIVPEAITGEKDEVDEDGNPLYQGIDQSKLVPLLTAALQEAVAEINALKDRLTAAGL